MRIIVPSQRVPTFCAEYVPCITFIGELTERQADDIADSLEDDYGFDGILFLPRKGCSVKERLIEWKYHTLNICLRGGCVIGWLFDDEPSGIFKNEFDLCLDKDRFIFGFNSSNSSADVELLGRRYKDFNGNKLSYDLDYTLDYATRACH